MDENLVESTETEGGGQQPECTETEEVKKEPECTETEEVKKEPECTETEDEKEPVEYEKEPVEYEKETVEYEKEPVKYEKQPVEYEKESVEYEKEPVEYEKEPVEYEKEPVEYEKEPVEYQKEPECTETEDDEQQPLDPRKFVVNQAAPNLIGEQIGNEQEETPDGAISEPEAIPDEPSYAEVAGSSYSGEVCSIIDIGDQIHRWNLLKQILNVTRDDLLTKLLLDNYECLEVLDNSYVAYDDNMENVDEPGNSSNVPSDLLDPYHLDADTLGGVCHGTVPVKRGRGRPRKIRVPKPKIVKEQKIMKCDICDFEEPGTKKTLDAHYWKEHSGFRKYACDQCEFIANRPDYLWKHHKRMHDAEKVLKYSCQFEGCDYKAYERKTLIRHQLRHTGEKPFQCEICYLRFAGKHTLRNHQAVHSDMEKYVCDECGKRFKRLGAVQRHMKTHTMDCPYKCDICPFKTRQQYNLVVHKRRHTGERPYLCDNCGYTTPYQALLKQHTCLPR